MSLELLTLNTGQESTKYFWLPEVQQPERQRCHLWACMLLTLTPIYQLILALLPPAYFSDSSSFSFFPRIVTHPSISLHYPLLYLCYRCPHSIPGPCDTFSTQQFSSNTNLTMEAPAENVSVTTNFTKHIIQTVCFSLQGSAGCGFLILQTSCQATHPLLGLLFFERPRYFPTQGLCACSALCLKHYSPILCNLLTFHTSA